MRLTNSEIRQARPSLAVVAPLTFWLCVGYVLLNAVLAYVIYSQPDTADLAVYKLFSQHFLGVVFALVGIGTLVSLALNSWKSTRIILGIGLFLKALYAYSLIDLGFRIGMNQLTGILALWLTLVWVQFCMIVFFSPPLVNGNNHVDGR